MQNIPLLEYTKKMISLEKFDYCDNETGFS